MAKKSAVVDAVAFEAYAPFEFRGEQYEAGETFTPPHGLKRDVEFDQFRQMSKQTDLENPGGIAFFEELPPVSPKGDPQVRRHILPLKEAIKEA